MTSETKKRYSWGNRKRWRKTRNDNCRPSNSGTKVKNTYNYDTASSSSTEGPQNTCASPDRSTINNPLPKITEEMLVRRDNNGESNDSDTEYYEIIDDDDSENDDGDSPSECASLLPTARELSKELSNVVFGCRSNPEKHFRRKAILSLSIISGWVEMKDPTFLKHFLTYGGAAKIIDFLQEILSGMEEAEYSVGEEHNGELRYRINAECIRMAARIISGVTCRERNRNTFYNANTAARIRHLAGVTATLVVNHDGLETLLLASGLCCGCAGTSVAEGSSSMDSEALLGVSEELWSAIANTCSGTSDEVATLIIHDLSISLWDAGLEVMETFDIDSGISAPKTTTVSLLRASVFRTFRRILSRSRDNLRNTRRVFAEESILSRSLEILASVHVNVEEEAISELDSSFCKSSNMSVNTGISSISFNESLLINNTGERHGTIEEESLLVEALSFFYDCQTQDLLFPVQEDEYPSDESCYSEENSQDLLPCYSEENSQNLLPCYSEENSQNLLVDLDEVSLGSEEETETGRNGTIEETMGEEVVGYENIIEESLSSRPPPIEQLKLLPIRYYWKQQSIDVVPPRRIQCNDVESVSAELSISRVLEWQLLRENLIPLCVAGLQKFAVNNSTIRRSALRILSAALQYSSQNGSDDEQVLLTAEQTDGAIEALGPCLTSDRVDKTEKDEIRGVIRKVVGVW